MSIYRKCHIVIFTTLLTFGCVSALADPQLNNRYPVEQCNEAKLGKLKVKLVNYSDPLTSSYLFDCAVSVSISGPSLINGESKNKAQRLVEKERKTKIADFFLLSREIDINFKNKYGDTLLMSVISSFLPEEWKEKAVEVLIEKGVNINEKNINGDVAMDLAKYRGSTAIINILSASGDRDLTKP